MFDVHNALRTLVERGGSDLHLKVFSPPLFRIYGELGPIDGEAALTEEDTEAALQAVLPDESKQREFDNENEADFSFEMADISRFRVNAYRQRGHISLAFRAIPNSIRSVDDLQLPPVVRELAEEERGIILLTGTTGSGKSTTLAAMINHINTTMAKHIVTIEDPIEYVHVDKRSAINQREVGMDTATFGRAMRRVLRQDPDVILIGEMRDEETVRAALSAAETGHLVLSTVHTLDASESINRILDFFPPHQHSQARAMIAGTLRGVISQRLVRSVDGGRVAVCEILRMTGRVRDMIKDPEQMGKLGDVIFTGGYYGMQTFDQALFKHVKARRVNFDDALRVATSPHDFKLLVEADGKRGTTMEDVAEAQAKRAPAGAAPSPTSGATSGATAGVTAGATAGASPTPPPPAAAPGAASLSPGAAGRQSNGTAAPPVPPAPPASAPAAVTASPTPPPPPAPPAAPPTPATAPAASAGVSPGVSAPNPPPSAGPPPSSNPPQSAGPPAANGGGLSPGAGTSATTGTPPPPASPTTNGLSAGAGTVAPAVATDAGLSAGADAPAPQPSPAGADAGSAGLTPGAGTSPTNGSAAQSAAEPQTSPATNGAPSPASNGAPAPVSTPPVAPPTSPGVSPPAAAPGAGTGSAVPNGAPAANGGLTPGAATIASTAAPAGVTPGAAVPGGEAAPALPNGAEANPAAGADPAAGANGAPEGGADSGLSAGASPAAPSVAS